jgi:basic membrane protein A and related proteins
MYRRPNLTFGGKLKRVSKLVAVLAAAVLVTTGCSSSSSDNAGGDVKVGLAYDIGGRGDKSFNDSAALGLDEAKAEFGVEAKEVTVTTGSDSEREDKLRLLAEAGYNPIIAVGYLYAGPLKAVSADYPDINFGIIDDSSVAAPNVASLIFAEEQGSYLVGIAAALESKSGKVGYIGGVRTPLLQKFEAGFAAGVKATKPSATVDVKYISEPPDFSGFNDPAKAKVIAKGMIDKGADVIYTAAGGSGAGTFAAAIDAGTAGKKVWTIGVDSDQYLTASAAEQANMLTSMLKRVDRAVYDVIAAAVNGTSVNDVIDAAAGTFGRVYSLELDGVGVSYSGDHATKYKDQIDKAAADIKSGAITVPTKP